MGGLKVAMPHTRISTHSRAKAAGKLQRPLAPFLVNFNSQPREGGWAGWQESTSYRVISTHSRAKAAGKSIDRNKASELISTHSRAKAAGRVDVAKDFFNAISTHSRAKAAGSPIFSPAKKWVFQLTAARRRLVLFRLGVVDFDDFNSQPREGGWCRR